MEKCDHHRRVARGLYLEAKRISTQVEIALFQDRRALFEVTAEEAHFQLLRGPARYRAQALRERNGIPCYVRQPRQCVTRLHRSLESCRLLSAPQSLSKVSCATFESVRSRPKIRNHVRIQPCLEVA
jgi:hypothetical protein